MTIYPARPSLTALTIPYEWEKLFAVSGIADGVDGGSSGTGFQPTVVLATGVITIQPGTAIIKGQLWRSDGVQTKQIDMSAGVNHADTLVLQLNRDSTDPNGVVNLVVKKGASTTVTPPRQDALGNSG